MRPRFFLPLFFILFPGGAGAGPPLWIAVGGEGRRLTSPDALHWREIPAVTPASPLLAIACDGTRFIATGGTAGASLTLSTSDGEHWRRWASAPGEIAVIVAGQSGFVALRGGRLLTAASEDRFTEGESLPLPGEVHPRQMACGDTEAGYRYVAIGELDSPAGSIPWRGVTDDGLHWTHTARDTAPARAIAHGGGIFVVAGPDSLLETSHDGEIWTRRELAAPDDLTSLVWTGREFIAQGRHLQSSPDGFTWSLDDADAPGPLLWARSLRPTLALSWSGVLLGRTDRNWTPVALSTGPGINAVAACLQGAAPGSY